MRLSLLAGCMLFSSFVIAQSAPGYFKPVSENTFSLPETSERKLIPLQYETYWLDYAGLKTALTAAPEEFSAAARRRSFRLALPVAGGAVEEFALWEVETMEPELAAQLPELRTYAGQSLFDSRKSIRISCTPRGFRAMILRPDFGLEFIEPLAWGQDMYYMVYDGKNVPDSEWTFRPGDLQVADLGQMAPPSDRYAPPVEERGTTLAPVTRKTYRLVVATTGEFGEDHGNTAQEVFAAVLEYVNQINAVYERDMAVRFQLIQASLLVMFTDPETDPFTPPDNGTLAGQNQIALDGANISPNSYDIGHVFARGGGGIGGLGVVCQPSKSFGATAGSGSYGQRFIFVACQELGHQFGGNHTWNRCGGGAPDQRAGSTAYEPGSGSTIMSYAGGCGGDNVVGVADLYFHAGSIEEIGVSIQFGTANICGNKTVTDNTPPSVTLAYQDNFFIPIGTPFELNGSGFDADGDALSFSWEEMDIGPEAPLGQQVASSPIFRSLPSGPATNRHFPKLSTVLNNATDPRELLPEYTRDLTFRFTARDNRPGGGGVAWADVAFKAWENAGPFRVQLPNTGSEVWRIGEYTEVRWDVANTDKAPVNCSHVNIRLSTDGGLTYPITLASRAANDGSHYVKVPDIPTNLARLRIDGADNVFFDISNQNFSIQQPVQPSFSMGLSNDQAVLCLPAVQVVEIATAGVLGFNMPVSLDIAGSLPPNVTAQLSATTLLPGEGAMLTLDFSAVDVEETFVITLQATIAGQPPILRDIVITTIRNDFSSLALTLPVDGATELQLIQTLRWNKAVDALTYDVQVATDPSFDPGTIVASVSSTTLDSFRIPVLLGKGIPYFWRVRPKNECGVHDWTEPFFFSTFAEKCIVWAANDLPKSLTSNGTPTIQSTVTVNAGGVIKGMEVRKIQGYHAFFRDLDVRLTGPQGNSIVLWSAKCGNFNGSFNLRMTDEATSVLTCPPTNFGNPFKPQEPLSAFVGQVSAGDWTLVVKDTEYGGGGTIEAFELEFCSEVIINPPYLVNNNPLLIDPGLNKSISPDLLLVEDANNTHSQLLYTLVSVPRFGHLERDWTGAMAPGDQFTQADIDNGALRYFDHGTSQGMPDGFRFVVTDGEGGFLGTPLFVIQTPTVGSHEPSADSFGFRVFPNPAQDVVWLALDRPAQNDLLAIVFNAAGQRVQEFRVPAGAERLSWQTAGLARGLYFVQVQGIARKLILR